MYEEFKTLDQPSLERRWEGESLWCLKRGTTERREGCDGSSLRPTDRQWVMIPSIQLGRSHHASAVLLLWWWILRDVIILHLSQTESQCSAVLGNGQHIWYRLYFKLAHCGANKRTHKIKLLLQHLNFKILKQCPFSMWHLHIPAINPAVVSK